MELLEELTITLIKPITRGSADAVTELKLREPMAGELDRMARAAAKAGSGVAGMNMLISAISGVELPFIEKCLSARDYRRAEVYLSAFLSDSPADGAASSPT